MAKAKVKRLFEEKRSGVKARPQLALAIASLKPGDVFVIWKVDRVARSLMDLQLLVQQVVNAGAVFRSLTESFDTSTASGRLMLHMLGAFAEFEREIIRERSIAGQDAAFARGARFGRPRGLDPQQEAECLAFYSTKQYTLEALAEYYGCHRETVRRALKRARAPHLAVAATKMAQRAAVGTYPYVAR